MNYARDMFEQTPEDRAGARVGAYRDGQRVRHAVRDDAGRRPNARRCALSLAVDHAREACRLEPQSAEAWATLGFVLDRVGAKLDALAAAERAVMIEPDNWRHHFRLAYIGWGEERLRAAGRTLALLPDFPLAHWLAATVYVARQALPDAERELSLGVAVDAANGTARSGASVRSPCTGCSACSTCSAATRLGRSSNSTSSCRRNMPATSTRRECAANTWYAIGALKLRQKRRRRGAARRSSRPSIALRRIRWRESDSQLRSCAPVRPRPSSPSCPSCPSARQPSTPLSRAPRTRPARVLDAEAARTIEAALAEAPPGSAGWLLPIEPLLHVAAHPDVWTRALAQLRNRAS